MATQPGWSTLGSALAGGNQLPAQLAEAQGEQLGANTTNAIAEANQRIAKNKAMAALPALLQQNPDFAGALGQTLAGAAQAGVNPQELYGARKTGQETDLQSGVADPNTSTAQTGRNLLALGKPADLIKPVGTAGDTLDLTKQGQPDQYGQLPLGAQLGQASIAEKNAAATGAGASAGLHKAQADVVATGGKPPQNMQWGINEDGSPKVDINGQRVAVPITGSKSDPNAAGVMSAVEARTMERVINSAKQADSMLSNLSGLKSGTSAGILGVGAAPGHSILQTTLDDARNSLSSQETNQYTTIMTGLNQALATMETFGQVPRGSFTDSMNRLVLRQGDTPLSKATKVADAGQIVNNAIETLLQNPRLPPSQAAYLNKIRDSVNKSIPYTVQDTLALQDAPPGTTLGTLVKARQTAAGATSASGATGAAPAAATPASVASAVGAPPVGTVEKGYRFRGGDASKAENWDEVQE
jgi:hypothetical protein